jgi:hypothetical protein
MQEVRAGKPGLCPLLEGRQPFIGFFVEVEDRARTDRNMHLILEVIAYPIIGNQLVLGHIDGIGLQVEAILHRPIHPLRKSGHKSISLVVLKNLCLVFDHEPRDVDINDLAITCHTELARASLARFAESPTLTNLDLLFHKSYAITPADLRKSILTLAVQGKLVPQDPNDEVVEVLTDRVAELRKQLFVGRRARAVKKVRELDESKFNHDIPSNWMWCRLGDLVLDFRYGNGPESKPSDAFWPNARNPGAGSPSHGAISSVRMS